MEKRDRKPTKQQLNQERQKFRGSYRGKQQHPISELQTIVMSEFLITTEVMPTALL